MNDFEAAVRATYEPLAGRPLTDAEVAEVALSLRQFAGFLIGCGQDENLQAKLELPPSAAPRVIGNTSQNGQKPQETRLPTETVSPTASSRDALPHRDLSAASIASASPAGQPVAVLANQSSTGATVDGSA